MYYMQRITYTYIMYLNPKITLMKVMNFMCIITSNQLMNLRR